jgi:serine/threonine protein kinase/tetratricopeptide (TPR) repeat protein
MSFRDLCGQTLGQYKLRELLGIGGMGAVYRAGQTSLNREVAVKVMSSELVDDAGYVERFYREAEIAASLGHPHIIPIHDYGVQGDISYLVMRLLEGGTLMDRLGQCAKTQQPLPSVQEVAELLDQLASALDYAHSRNVIHRDIKPNNIMFDDQGNAYLVDFGIAKLLQTTGAMTNPGVVMGTPLFMPPEQWRSEEITPAVDQYALAVVIYILLTGQAPFKSGTPYGLMDKHVNETPAPPHTHRAELPEDITPVLERALAKEPAHRFPTVSAFAQAFSDAISASVGERTNFFSAPVQPTRPAGIKEVPESEPGQHFEALAVPAIPRLASPPARGTPGRITPGEDDISTVVDTTRDDGTAGIAVAGKVSIPRLVLFIGLALFLVSVPVVGEIAIRLIRTGDQTVSMVGGLTGVAGLAGMLLPLVGLWQLSRTRRALARLPGPSWLPLLAFQVFVLLTVGFGRSPLLDVCTKDVLARVRVAATAGQVQATGDLIRALVILNQDAAGELAGEFNDEGVASLAKNDLTQARLYLEAVRTLDEAVPIGVGRNNKARSISRYSLAQLREMENDQQAAIVTYREAIKLDDANFEARYGLSSLLLITSDAADKAALDEAVAVARAGWEDYIGKAACSGRQNLADENTFQISWHCFALLTTEAGARLKRNSPDQGDIPSVIETRALQATRLAEANDQFRIRPGYCTAEAYYYLALVTAPNTDKDILCRILQNYDNANPRHDSWAKYANEQLAGRTCQPDTSSQPRITATR